jgi:uncharacterized protein YceK
MSRVLLVIIMCSGCATKHEHVCPREGHGPCPNHPVDRTWFIWDEFLK